MGAVSSVSTWIFQWAAFDRDLSTSYCLSDEAQGPAALRRSVIFPREGRLWNFGGTHKIRIRFLTKSTGSTWVGKEQRDNVETEKRVRRRECKRYTLRSFSLLFQSWSSNLPQEYFL